MNNIKIWAHRGCSQHYPENTILAFEKAMEIPNLTGIELDIQLTRDGEMVVIHDERVDRTTEGTGYVRDFTLSQLKRLHIYAGEQAGQQIPTIGETLDLLGKRLRQGMLLNIELKNSVYPYPGMEEKIVALVHERGLEQSIVYSSFYAKSLERIHVLDAGARLGVLDSRVSDCLYKAKGFFEEAALHPFWRGMDLPARMLEGRTVRAWLSGHLFPEKPTGTRLDLAVLRKQGITDVILNEPEAYELAGAEPEDGVEPE